MSGRSRLSIGVVALTGCLVLVPSAQQQTPPVQTAPPPAQGRGASPAGQPDNRNVGPGGTARPGAPGTNMLREWEWWKDDEVKKDLGLSDKIAADIDNYYQMRLRQMMPFVDALNRERDVLNQMSIERKVDEDTYAAQVTVFESLLFRLRESRTVMLYHIYRKLTPEQNTKLDAARTRHFQRGRGGTTTK